MSEKSFTALNKPYRFFINLPEHKEISYDDLLDLYNSEQEYESSQSLSSIHSRSYQFRIRELINYGETYGMSSKLYKYKKNSSEDETESQSMSCISSFIDADSDESLGNTEEFQLALDEGFYIITPSEFLGNNPLKRCRASDLYEIPEEVNIKIQEIKDIYNKKTYKQIPKSVSKILKEINDIIEKYELLEKKETIFKYIGDATSLGSNKIIEAIQKMIENDNKKNILNQYKKKFIALKKFIICFCRNGREWSQNIECLYQDLIEKLKDYVEVSNEFNRKYDAKNEVIDFELEKEKVDEEIKKLGARRSGIHSQPIEISSESLEMSLPGKGKLFEQIVEFNINDFV